MQFQNLRDFQPTLVKPKSLIYIEFLCQLFLYLIYLGSNFIFQELWFLFIYCWLCWVFIAAFL